MRQLPRKSSLSTLAVIALLLIAWAYGELSSQQQKVIQPLQQPEVSQPLPPAAPSDRPRWSAADLRLLRSAGVDPATLEREEAARTIQRLALDARDIIFILKNDRVRLQDVVGVARDEDSVIAFLADYEGSAGQELGWSHIVSRHVMWTDRGRRGGTTSLFPTGEAGTPRRMSQLEVRQLIIEGIENELPAVQPDDNDRTELVYRLPASERTRLGIDRMQIVLEPWGAVVTAYPLSGDAVTRRSN